MATTTFFITTPIYYVNDLPHIGHIFTTTAADTLARYHRLAGEEVRFLSGTDEHGQNIERAARREGITPLELADRVVSRYDELKETFGFSYDDFVRTTEERHERGVIEMIRRIDAAGDFYVATHEGWYCSPCETFYTEKELLPGKRCPVHVELGVEWKSEQNVFFRLSRYQQPLLDWYAAHPEAVRPSSRANEMRSFVEAGLRDLSVSRANLEWGIRFPGHAGQTVYVWLDALTNYVSALGLGSEPSPLYRRFWAEGTMRMHMIGKDILRFHAVYWPAFLMSAGLPLPTTVWAHGWWQRDGRKVSKSAGNIVRPDELVARFGADSLRYFLLREMVFGQDASFSDEAFVDRYNSDLAKDLGNTVKRVVTLSRTAFGGRTPFQTCTQNPLIAAAGQATAGYRKAMAELAFQQALKSLWKLLAETNQYLVSREPWNLIKSEGASDRLARILWNGLEAIRIVATGLLPFMPRVAPGILRAVAAPVPGSLDALAWGGTLCDAPLPEPTTIFPLIDKEAFMADVPLPAPPAVAVPASALPAGDAGDAGDPKAAPPPAASVPPASAAAAAAAVPATISIDRFMESELRVATIRAAEPVAKSKKLLKLTVDLGGESRTVVAGIALVYRPEELVGRQVVVVANLEPAKLMGVESHGMVLAASVDGAPVLLHPAAPVPDGTRVG
ncbi:MAG TPA: methionine--tRNA ligase [Thermoanaerobaculia bacterium]|nr:methionine--tRNA ligase [Thermoanaerobaculia bacterium]